MNSNIVVFGTNTAGFVSVMKQKYLKSNVHMHFYDYVLIVNDKLEMQSNDLQSISEALGREECTLLTKSEYTEILEINLKQH